MGAESKKAYWLLTTIGYWLLARKTKARNRIFDTHEDDYWDISTFRHFDILTVSTQPLNF